ncbi:sigma factor-like helix-turn-helix DNA-binding protein [Streptomyces sp. NPDC053048]|uniref:sigma factor-like helix-turn-helix DNA-binding protein n=1 Tax=Streptomyces sp. NPDC053048 TaxID=3365694 RepID=UPI0037D51969
MRERQAARERRRAREFEVFVGGAGGRLLHAALLLTGEPREAERLLTSALARTYAAWDGLRGEDPYDRARRDLATAFVRSARRYRHHDGAILGRLPPRERLVLVLRLYEGVAEEQTAACLGLSVERVRTLCARAVATTSTTPPVPSGLRGSRAR